VFVIAETQIHIFFTKNVLRYSAEAFQITFKTEFNRKTLPPTDNGQQKYDLL
jgi:hypothetical protein